MKVALGSSCSVVAHWTKQKYLYNELVDADWTPTQLFEYHCYYWLPQRVVMKFKISFHRVSVFISFEYIAIFRMGVCFFELVIHTKIFKNI